MGGAEAEGREGEVVELGSEYTVWEVIAGCCNGKWIVMVSCGEGGDGHKQLRRRQMESETIWTTVLHMSSCW